MRHFTSARARTIGSLSAVALGAVVLLSAATQAQAQQPMMPPAGQGAPMAPMSGQVTMMLFRVVKSGDQQCLLTPAGKLLPVPGNNIPADITTVPIYRDAANNYWYTNRQGQPVAISPDKVNWAVRYLESQPGPNMGMMPQQGMGYQPPVQQTTIIQQPPQQQSSSNSSSNSSGSGSSALGTGLAAAGGAMMGSMIGDAMYHPYSSGYGYGSSYYGMPYGTPMYREGSNVYYYNNSGNKTYVDATKENQAMVNQWNHQGNWNDRNAWANTQNANATAQHAENRSNFQNAAQTQQTQQGRRLFNRGNSQNSGGRFGSAEDTNDSQGRFGRRLR